MTCAFCHTAQSTGTCEFPVARGEECKQPVCPKCSGVASGGMLVCPDHRQRAGLRPLIRLDTEGARWITAKFDSQCKVADCRSDIETGERVLYLPKEKAALCDDCGTDILR